MNSEALPIAVVLMWAAAAARKKGEMAGNVPATTYTKGGVRYSVIVERDAVAVRIQRGASDAALAKDVFSQLMQELQNEATHKRQLVIARREALAGHEMQYRTIADAEKPEFVWQREAELTASIAKVERLEAEVATAKRVSMDDVKVYPRMVDGFVTLECEG